MGAVLEISGTLQNIRMAEYVHDFIRNFINAQWHAYNAEKRLNRYRKTDFAVGILGRISFDTESQRQHPSTTGRLFRPG